MKRSTGFSFGFGYRHSRGYYDHWDGTWSGSHARFGFGVPIYAHTVERTYVPRTERRVLRFEDGRLVAWTPR